MVYLRNECLMLVLCMPHIHMSYYFVTQSSEVEKIDSKRGIFMFSRSAHQADRWLSIKTMHFLVFCIISVKIKRLSETPPWSFWKKTKTVVPLAASSFEPSAIILPPVLSPLLVCCLQSPDLQVVVTMCWWHAGEICRQGIMVTHLFNCQVTGCILRNYFLGIVHFISGMWNIKA